MTTEQGQLQARRVMSVADLCCKEGLWVCEERVLAENSGYLEP
jgi:hypothetical protein